MLDFYGVLALCFLGAGSFAVCFRFALIPDPDVIDMVTAGIGATGGMLFCFFMVKILYG